MTRNGAVLRALTNPAMTNKKISKDRIRLNLIRMMKTEDEKRPIVRLPTTIETI